MTDTFTIQLRNDTAANWLLYNPVLLTGEAGVETDTSRIKIGDGLTPWNLLAYWVQPATAQLQSDWNESDNAQLDYIKNKPAIPFVSGAPYTASGKYFSAALGISTVSATVTIVSNTMNAYPFYVAQYFNITAISQHVKGVSTAGIKLCCYADSGGFYPGSKLFTAGTVTSTTDSIQSINYSYGFAPGNIYWLVSIGGASPYSSGSALGPANYTAWNPLLNIFGVSAGTNNMFACVYLSVLSAGSYATPPSTFPAGAAWQGAINYPMNPILTIA